MVIFCPNVLILKYDLDYNITYSLLPFARSSFSGNPGVTSVHSFSLFLLHRSAPKGITVDDQHREGDRENQRLILSSLHRIDTSPRQRQAIRLPAQAVELHPTKVLLRWPGSVVPRR